MIKWLEAEMHEFNSMLVSEGDESTFSFLLCNVPTVYFWLKYSTIKRGLWFMLTTDRTRQLNTFTDMEEQCCFGPENEKHECSPGC